MASVARVGLIETYLYNIYHSLSIQIIIPRVILELIGIYLYEWIEMKHIIGHSAPPHLLFDAEKNRECILISDKNSNIALIKYYEEMDEYDIYVNQPNDFTFYDHTISIDHEKALIYFVGGVSAQFCIYSMNTNKWITRLGATSVPNDFDMSCYSPSICIKNEFHWITRKNQKHYIWDNNQQRFHQCFQFPQNDISASFIVYVERLNKLMLIASNTSNQERFGSIWFSSNIVENKYEYKWIKSECLTMPCNVKLFGCIQTDNMLVIFGGADGFTQSDDIWCLLMNGDDLNKWKWKKSKLKCPMKTWYHAVLTKKSNNIHLFDEYYGGKLHWMINLEAILLNI